MSKTNAIPYIGSYVLETLTTGMYGQSENALREYVQNSFDSIRAAIRLGVMTKGEGRIDVTVSASDALIIRDNGVGISASAAWGTLTSIGASKKDRTKDAGFRGIGRLAGIAFCKKLVFRTKAAEEANETTVTFDCVALREGMSPDTGGSLNLADLLLKSVSMSTSKAARRNDHFMEVTLSGLGEAPAVFRDLDQIRDYLAETSPIDYDPTWAGGKEVSQKAAEAGWTIETVKLYVAGPGQASRPVYKLYKGSFPLKGGKNQKISRIKSYPDPQRNWWGWVGFPDVTAMITDERVHGLRIRVKNIQIDSTTIFDELFAAKNVSYARFNTWYIGEVHINASLLIPNARRDGFEDTEAWTKLKLELSNEICAGLAKQAYDLSKDRQKGIEKIEKDVASLASKSEKYALKGEDSDERYRLLSSNATLKAKISAALEGALPETQLRFKAQLSALETAKKRLSKGPESDQAEMRKQLVEQILEQVLLVLQTYLEPELFTTVKRALKSKIK
jgi:hypothetical protein